jgi:hypothetical protein
MDKVLRLTFLSLSLSLSPSVLSFWNIMPNSTLLLLSPKPQAIETVFLFYAAFPISFLPLVSFADQRPYSHTNPRTPVSVCSHTRKFKKLPRSLRAQIIVPGSKF